MNTHSPRKRVRTIDGIIDVIGLIRRAPRTMEELIELTSLSYGCVFRYVHALLEEGLVTPTKVERHKVFTWVPFNPPSPPKEIP